MKPKAISIRPFIGIGTEYWGKECFLHDPSGILWHFGEFFKAG